jgi:hypothetical protein
MALTLRTNGSSGVNLVTASWWNDYYNLFTGAMQDQLVTIKQSLDLKAIGAAPAAPATAVVAGTGLSIGAYLYAVTFTSADGETAPSATTGATTTTGNQKVNLSAIPLGPTGTTGRKLYRSKVGGGALYLLATLADNTTTTFADTTADTSLTVLANGRSSFGGSLRLYDGAGALQGTIYNDGGADLKQLWINKQVAFGATTTLDLVMGDNDTGFDWQGDGWMDIISNGVAVAHIFGGIWRSQVTDTSGGLGSPLARIFIGTTTPTGAVNGDIWIKA